MHSRNHAVMEESARIGEKVVVILAVAAAATATTTTTTTLTARVTAAITTTATITVKCDLLQKLTGFLQLLSCTFRYEPLRKILTMICTIIYAYTDTKDHAMCKGTIELQLPAVSA